MAGWVLPFPLLRPHWPWEGPPEASRTWPSSRVPARARGGGGGRAPGEGQVWRPQPSHSISVCATQPRGTWAPYAKQHSSLTGSGLSEQKGLFAETGAVAAHVFLSNQHAEVYARLWALGSRVTAFKSWLCHLAAVTLCGFSTP